MGTRPLVWRGLREQFRGVGAGTVIA
jgi:hypothetical protein